MTPAAPTTFDTALLWLIAGWASVAIGALLLLWALFRDRSRGRRRCPQCWYDMKGVPGLRCPECGRGAKHETKLFKTRRRWSWTAIALLLVLVGWVSTRIPRALEHGWLDAVPVVLLRPALWWERERAEKSFDKFTQWGSGLGSVAGSVPIAGPTQWERMLIASVAADRLTQNAAADPPGYYSDAAQVLAGLGREARIAERTLRRAAQGEHSQAAARWMMMIGPSSGMDFGDDIERFAVSSAASSERSGALKYSVARAIKEEHISRRLLEGIARGAPESSIAGGAIEEAKPPAESRAAVRMLRKLIESEDSQIRFNGIESAAHSAAIAVQLEDTLDQLWRLDLARDVQLGYARIIEQFSTKADRWGPRLVTLAESPDLFVRGRAVRTLARWVPSRGWAAPDLQRWLSQADMNALNGTPRDLITWMSDRLKSTDIHGTDGLAVLVSAAAQNDADADRLLSAVLLEHFASPYRIAAIRELRNRMPNSELVNSSLRHVLMHDDTPAVRREAIALLGLDLRDDQSRKAIALAAMQDSDSDVRVRAIGLAESLGADPEIDGKLTQFASDSTGPCAATAQAVLLRRQAAAAAEQGKPEQGSEASP